MAEGTWPNWLPKVDVPGGFSKSLQSTQAWIQQVTPEIPQWLRNYVTEPSRVEAMNQAAVPFQEAGRNIQASAASTMNWLNNPSTNPWIAQLQNAVGPSAPVVPSRGLSGAGRGATDPSTTRSLYNRMAWLNPQPAPGFVSGGRGLTDPSAPGVLAEQAAWNNFAFGTPKTYPATGSGSGWSGWGGGGGGGGGAAQQSRSPYRESLPNWMQSAITWRVKS